MTFKFISNSIFVYEIQFYTKSLIILNILIVTCLQKSEMLYSSL